MSNEFSRTLRVLRREHESDRLVVDALDPDPIRQFQRWMDEAIDADVHLPNAMTLATVGEDGRPSARITLLKGVDDRGFSFFTNYESRKGRQLEANPSAALVFYWGDLSRQVRVEGNVARLTEQESADYFDTRSRGSQLGAWASPQSSVISDRSELDRLVSEVEARFDGTEIALPPHWGGFLLRPERIEFWLGQPSRLHDRVLYVTDGDGGWHRERLAP